MNATFVRNNLKCAAALLLSLVGIAAAAGQPSVRATLLSAKERKAASDFSLKDASGKTVVIKDYRGKVVLLNFWATWCGGCKEELPWFAEFERKYGRKGLAVVGISLDDGGWNVVKPFLAKTDVPFQILLGDDATAKLYRIEAMPDTFLIDRRGKVATAYAGLVDKDNVEANLKALLGEH